MTETQGLDRTKARELCDRIQDVAEELGAIAGPPEHPAIVALAQAANEITASARLHVGA
ncbi:hypothetical protein ACFXG4_27050 [Nocardia sp. NPDC059246]|uniref:hypothetical protein n=1 Tax=unclassified Nocardia TaxID=2637762 RepID=UPI0036763BFE